MNISSPVLIASPVRRSGTTLLQRLLCSSDNTLVYGESCAGELQILLNVMTSRQLYFRASQEMRDEMLQEVLKGQVNDWIPDLMPDLNEYLKVLPQRYLSIFEYYQEFAQRHGRTIWGMKMAEWYATQIRQAIQIFPESKLLYIVRDLESCVRSAKRINVIANLQEIQQFAQTWQQNLQIVQTQIPAKNLMMIDYQDFIQNPQPIIEQIENFTGAKGIKQEVTEYRINTYKNDAYQETTGTGYIEPATLNDEELALIQNFSKITS